MQLPFTNLKIEPFLSCHVILKLIHNGILVILYYFNFSKDVLVILPKPKAAIIDLDRSGQTKIL